MSNERGSVRTTTTDRAGEPAASVTCLNALTTALIAAGYNAKAKPDGEPPFVRVVNPNLATVDPKWFSGLGEDISIAPGADGRLRFWWSWGDPIVPASDIAGAVTKIAKVLRACSQP